MPITSYLEDNDYFLPFDNITSSASVAILNPLSYKTITVSVTFRDQQGNQFYSDSFTLGPLAHTAFSLPQRYPPSQGHLGVVEFKTPDPALSMLGLRFGAVSFTSILPLTPGL